MPCRDERCFQPFGPHSFSTNRSSPSETTESLKLNVLLSAAVLLDRARLEAFAAALARAAARDAAGLHIDCVGPLPPFTFAELRI